MAAPSAHFGPFSFDSISRELFRDGLRVRIALKPLQVLEVLLRRPGELVTRDTLRQELWPDDTFVDFDNNLNAAVRKLREALCDNADCPQFIETLPRRGYRFIAPLNDREVVPADLPIVASPTETFPRRFTAAIAVVAVSVTVASIWVTRTMSPRLISVAPFENVSGDVSQQPIAQALSIELTTRLATAKQPRFRVADVAPSSSQTALTEKVDYVVQGSTHRDATGLYVTARLVDAHGRLVWGDAFMCPMGDSARIRRQLADKISEALAQELDHSSAIQN